MHAPKTKVFKCIGLISNKRNSGCYLKMSEQKPNFKHIVRVANVDIPGDRPTRVALTKIKGIGMNFANVLCTITGVDKEEKAGNLTEDEVKKLNTVVENPEIGRASCRERV